MHKYVIMGIQGCGKGTQAKLLARKYDLTHISVGDILRWNIQNHTKLAARIKRIVAAGHLVSDEIVADIVHQRLQDHDWNFGFILDGFPRNGAQARFFLEGYDIDAVINLEVPDEVVLERVLSRRLCEECGLDYNLIHHRPEQENQCDVCGGRLVCREDDTREAALERMQEFHLKTEPVLELFGRKELIINVDGARPVQDIHREILLRLGS